MSGGQTQISEALRLARAGNFAAAERLCRDLIRREPANAGAIMLSGLIAASRGENDKAVTLFERAIALQPQRSDAHFNLGLIRVRQGRDRHQNKQHQQSTAAVREKIIHAVHDPGHTHGTRF